VLLVSFSLETFPKFVEKKSGIMYNTLGTI